MTGQQIYELASSFLYENDNEDADSKKFAVGFLNILMQECFDAENSMREFKAQTLLEEAPLITSLAETIPYQAPLTRVALPYGLAAQYFQEAMDNYQAENYRNKYIAAVNEAKRMVYAKVGE